MFSHAFKKVEVELFVNIIFIGYSMHGEFIIGLHAHSLANGRALG